MLLDDMRHSAVNLYHWSVYHWILPEFNQNFALFYGVLLVLSAVVYGVFNVISKAENEHDANFLILWLFWGNLVIICYGNVGYFVSKANGFF